MQKESIVFKYNCTLSGFLEGTILNVYRLPPAKLDVRGDNFNAKIHSSSFDEKVIST